MSDRQQVTEPRLRTRFRAWLDELDDKQIEALAENWDNVMNDAALDRVDSWVIATRTIAEIRGEVTGEDHDHDGPGPRVRGARPPDGDH